MTQVRDGVYVSTSRGGGLDWFFDKWLEGEMARCSAMDAIYARHAVDMLQPTLMMRVLGYTRPQFLCHHQKQKFTDSAMRWRCADCGKDL
jgi:hypothetical protein